MRWAIPVSVALTEGISVDFFYLRLLICLNLAGHLPHRRGPKPFHSRQRRLLAVASSAASTEGHKPALSPRLLPAITVAINNTLGRAASSLGSLSTKTPFSCFSTQSPQKQREKKTPARANTSVACRHSNQRHGRYGRAGTAAAATPTATAAPHRPDTHATHARSRPAGQPASQPASRSSLTRLPAHRSPFSGGTAGRPARKAAAASQPASRPASQPATYVCACHKPRQQRPAHPKLLPRRRNSGQASAKPPQPTPGQPATAAHTPTRSQPLALSRGSSGQASAQPPQPANLRVRPLRATVQAVSIATAATPILSIA